MANTLALMDLISRKAYESKDAAFQRRVDDYLIKLAEKMDIDSEVITDAILSEDNYAIFVP
jgi:hypothetical protein